MSSDGRTRHFDNERRHEPVHVLLVDASPDSLEMYREWCRHAGLVALTAADPIVAMAMARQQRPQVVVAEVRICRGFDGLELFEQLRCDPATADIPRLVLTGFITPAARELAELSGCQAFLPKPCAPELLVEEIARALRRRRVGPFSRAARRPSTQHRTRPFA